jgi:hypothetical protein
MYGVTRIRTRWCARLAVGVFLLALGCEGEKKAVAPASAADAGAPKGAPGVDPDLAEAMREVAGVDPGAPPQSGAGQPPPSGVFAPGAADREVAPGAAPKVTVGGTGSAPRLTSSGLVLPAKKPREISTTVSVRTGPRAALPTLDLLLRLEAAAPKQDGKEGAALPLDVTGKVARARLAAEQPGRLPAGLDAEVAKLSGSKVTYVLRPDGSAADISIEVGKGVDEGLGRILGFASELFGTLHLPYPKEPVGPGAFWMVASRERYVGLDVVTYRMFRVERVEGDRATLSVSTKRYVAGGTVDFPGLPPHRVAEFRGEGRGELVVADGQGVVEGRLQDSLLANLEPEGQPGRIPVQLETSGMVTVPPESRRLPPP